MRNYKLSEHQSTSSTLQSVIGTPQSKQSICLFGTKKFTRKRDSSTQSLRKSSGGNTPNPNNNIIGQKQTIDKKEEKVEDLNLNKIIKTNSYIKWFQSPTTRKSSQISEPSTTKPEYSNAIQNFNIIKQKTQSQILQNIQISYETPKNKQSQKTSSKSFQNFRVLNSTTNATRSRKQIQQTTYNLYNYSQAQTQRQPYLGLQKTDNLNDIKVLENEIIILQDENARLKKQIAQLNSEKDHQAKKRLQIQNQLKQLEKKYNELNNLQIQAMKIVKDNIHQIYFQMIEDFKSSTNQIQITQKQKKFFSQEPQSPIKSRQNKTKKPQYSDMNQFIKQFMEPAKQILYENIRKYGKILQNSKVNINKLQIRQNVMMRGSFQLQNVKNENKILNEQVKTERDKSKRFKDQCQKLRKQNNQIKKVTITKNKTISQNLLGNNEKRNTSTSQQFVSLVLSDGSDDEYTNLRVRKTRR